MSGKGEQYAEKVRIREGLEIVQGKHILKAHLEEVSFMISEVNRNYNGEGMLEKIHEGP